MLTKSRYSPGGGSSINVVPSYGHLTAKQCVTHTCLLRPGLPRHGSACTSLTDRMAPDFSPLIVVRTSKVLKIHGARERMLTKDGRITRDGRATKQFLSLPRQLLHYYRLPFLTQFYPPSLGPYLPQYLCILVQYP